MAGPDFSVHAARTLKHRQLCLVLTGYLARHTLLPTTVAGPRCNRSSIRSHSPANIPRNLLYRLQLGASRIFVIDHWSSLKRHRALFPRNLKSQAHSGLPLDYISLIFSFPGCWRIESDLGEKGMRLPHVVGGYGCREVGCRER